MRVLIACEESGVVRRAFRERGHEAWSCDLLPSADNSEFHHQGDVLDFLAMNYLVKGDFDLIIAHPPCDYLAVSGNRWYAHRPDLYLPAVYFAATFFQWSNRVCVENPVGRLSKYWQKPTQYIQPWQFGHPETKKTGLWLKGLPPLIPTDITDGREQRVWKMGPGPDRKKMRSRTYEGVAKAMAEQWG